jgi:hypothetical protein
MRSEQLEILPALVQVLLGFGPSSRLPQLSFYWQVFHFGWTNDAFLATGEFLLQNMEQDL